VTAVRSGFFLKFQRQYSKLCYLKSKVRLFNLLPDSHRTKYTCKKFFSSKQRRYLHFCFDITRNGKKTLRLSVALTRPQKILYTCFRKFMGTRHSRRRISYYRHEKNRTRRFKKIKFFLHFIRYYKQQPTLLIPFFKLKFMELPYEEFQLVRFNRLLSIQRVVKPIQFFFLPRVLPRNPKQTKEIISSLPKNTRFQKNKLILHFTAISSQTEVLNSTKTFLQYAATT
jgi:hypothetical protein